MFRRCRVHALGDVLLALRDVAALDITAMPPSEGFAAPEAPKYRPRLRVALVAHNSFVKLLAGRRCVEAGPMGTICRICRLP